MNFIDSNGNRSTRIRRYIDNDEFNLMKIVPDENTAGEFNLAFNVKSTPPGSGKVAYSREHQITLLVSPVADKPTLKLRPRKIISIRVKQDGLT